MLGRADDAIAVGGAARDALAGDQHAELCLRLARAAVVAGRWTAAEDYVERSARPNDPRSLVLWPDAAFGAGRANEAAAIAAETFTISPALHHDPLRGPRPPKWPHAHGKPVVPSRWQATGVCNECYPPQKGLRLRDAAPMPTCSGRRLAAERLAAQRQDGRRTTPRSLRAVLASASRKRAVD